MKKLRLIIIIIAVFLLIFGFFGFFRGVFESTRKESNIKFLNELPLSDLKWIASDSKNNIYCVIPFYSRIQVYSSNGQFLYGIGINASGGDFAIKIAENDHLYVATVRNHMLYVYNNGILIEEKNKSYKYREFNRLSKKQVFDNMGNAYYIEKRPWYNSVITKQDSEGKTKVLIASSTLGYLLMGPFPAWTFAFIGIVIIFLNSWYYIKIKQKE